jgi:hypothetical protein
MMFGKRRPSRIVFVTFGKGSGDLLVGAALFNGLCRRGTDFRFTAITNSEFDYLVTPLFEHIFVRPEPEQLFLRDRQTELYMALKKTKPDCIIIYGIWVPVLPYIEDFRCPVLFVTRLLSDKWFSLIDREGRQIPFNHDSYDDVISIEPGFLPDPAFRAVEPVIIRNRDEILARDKARERLGVPPGKQCCVIAQNGYPGEIEKLIESHQGTVSDYHLVITSNRDDNSLFPLADYMAGIDLLISGAGYSLFYESRYFNVPSFFTSFSRNAEDTSWRITMNSDYNCSKNGADTLADTIMAML